MIILARKVTICLAALAASLISQSAALTLLAKRPGQFSGSSLFEHNEHRSEGGAVASEHSGGNLGQLEYSSEQYATNNHARLSKLSLNCKDQVDSIRTAYTDQYGVEIPSDAWGGNGDDRPIKVHDLASDEYIQDIRTDTCWLYNFVRVCYLLIHTNKGQTIECGTPNDSGKLYTAKQGKALLWIEGKYTDGRHHDAGIYSLVSYWIPIEDYFGEKLKFE